MDWAHRALWIDREARAPFNSEPGSWAAYIEAAKRWERWYEGGS